MKPGDRFVWYGEKETVIGTIYQIREKVGYDLTNGIKITKKKIIDLNGNTYEYNRCYRVEDTISPAFLKKVLKVFGGF
jgi:hypothetical protein